MNSDLERRLRESFERLPAASVSPDEFLAVRDRLGRRRFEPNRLLVVGLTAVALLAIAIPLRVGRGGPADGDVRRAATVLTRLAGSARDAGTLKTVWSSRLTGPDGWSYSFRSEGAVDFVRELAEARVTIKGSDGEPSEPCRVVSTADDLYVRVPESRRADYAGAGWLRTTNPARKAFPTDPFAIFDTSGVLSALGGMDELVHVGADEVRGVETQHYRGTLHLERLIGHLPAADRAAARREYEALEVKSLPAEVWLGPDDLVYRSRLTIVSPKAGDGGERLRGVATSEFFDYGAPVAIREPGRAAATNDPAAASPLVVCLGTGFAQSSSP